MAADLHIHVMAPNEVTDAEFCVFRGAVCNSNWDEWSRVYAKVADLPGVWVGEVSWLKAAIFGDEGNFIPSLVMNVQQLFNEAGGQIVIDEDFINVVAEQVDCVNTTDYDVAQASKIVDFLRDHIGKVAFPISW